MLSGMYDGKLRFKKVTTPALKKKIIIGGTFFGLSIGMLILSLVSLGLFLEKITLLIFAIGCLMCGGLLGLIRGTLLEAKLPNGK
jgi:hypothetical protein